MYFKYLQPAGVPELYVPGRHREMVEKIYARHGRQVRFGKAAQALAYDRSALHVSDKPGARLRVIRVVQISPSLLSDLAACLAQAVSGPMQTTYLDLVLDQPGVDVLCVQLEQQGFFFSGIKPMFWRGKDILRLQKLDAAETLAECVVVSPFTQELLDYVWAEKARLS